MNKKPKYEKPIQVDMSFDEMMQRLSKVDKTEVGYKIKKSVNKKKKSTVIPLENRRLTCYNNPLYHK